MGTSGVADGGWDARAGDDFDARAGDDREARAGDDLERSAWGAQRLKTPAPKQKPLRG